MPKTIKPRSETAGGRRRASSGPALAHGGHPITLDVMVRLQAIALPEAEGQAGRAARLEKGLTKSTPSTSRPSWESSV